MKISLIHASYGRPTLAMTTAWSWTDKTSGKHQIEYLLSIDQDDKSDYPDSINWKQDYIESKVIRNLTSTSVAAINRAASMSTGDIIVVMSDDFDCRQDWDDLIVQATAGKTDWILKTQDGTQPWIITLPIMDRTYYNRFGYVYRPFFLHMFCDCELTHQADILGRKITSNIEFKHNHYSVGGIKKDTTSIKADNTWEQGKKLYLTKCKQWQEEGIDIYDLPTEAKGHITWLKNEYGRFQK